MRREISSYFQESGPFELQYTLERFVRLTTEILNRRNDRHNISTASAAEIGRHFKYDMPAQAVDLDSIVSDIRKWVIPYSRNRRSVNYFAHMDVPPSNLAISAGLLIRALDQDPISYSSARSGTFIEKQVIRWLSSLAYGGVENSYGVMTSGGTQSNLQALLLLRNQAFAKAGIDINKAGLQGSGLANGKPRVVLLVTSAAHQSIFTAARFLGFGDAGICMVRTDDHDRADLQSIEEAIGAAHAAGQTVAALVMTAGTTGSGAVDPLKRAIPLAETHGVPVHVDAAHGGMLLLSETHKAVLDGIQGAASVTFDPHKILGLSSSLGFLAVRDQKLLKHLGKVELSYYNPEDEPDLGNLTIDNSRPLNSLGAWIVLRAVGKDGYGQLVDHIIALSQRFRQRLQASEFFDVLNGGVSNVVAFRPRLARDSKLSRSAVSEKMIDAVVADGQFSISRYKRASDGEIFMRSVFVNPYSTIENVDGLVDRIIHSYRYCVIKSVPLAVG